MLSASNLVPFVALALAVAQALGQQVTCFQGGVTGDCSSFITTFCSSIGTDVIGQGDAAARCFTVPTSNLRCDFTALNTRPGNFSISVENCEAALLKVIAACPMGGSGQFEGAPFQFFDDPNTGACTFQCGN